MYLTSCRLASSYHEAARYIVRTHACVYDCMSDRRILYYVSVYNCCYVFGNEVIHLAMFSYHNLELYHTCLYYTKQLY